MKMKQIIIKFNIKCTSVRTFIFEFLKYLSRCEHIHSMCNKKIIIATTTRRALRINLSRVSNLLNVMWIQKYVNYRAHGFMCWDAVGLMSQQQKELGVDGRRIGIAVECTLIAKNMCKASSPLVLPNQSQLLSKGVISTFLICQIANNLQMQEKLN